MKELSKLFQKKICPQNKVATQVNIKTEMILYWLVIYKENAVFIKKTQIYLRHLIYQNVKCDINIIIKEMNYKGAVCYTLQLNFHINKVEYYKVMILFYFS